MAFENKRLCGVELAAISTDLYTVPNAKKVIVKTISICNKTSDVVTTTLKLGSQYFLHEYPVDPHDTITLSPLDHILVAMESINGKAGTASALDIIISGRVEDV